MAAPKFEDKNIQEQKKEPVKTVGTKPKQVTKLFFNRPDAYESNRAISEVIAQMEQEGYTYYNYIPQSSNEKILIFKLAT